MNATSGLIAVVYLLGTCCSTGAQGPAGHGACQHVLGPVATNGEPIGFSCQDVGGNALLVWNASEFSGAINITGGIRTVSFSPNGLTLNGTINSNGSLALLGGSGLTINGTIRSPTILIATADTTEAEIKAALLAGLPQQLVASSSSDVSVGPTGKITATTGNLTIGGNKVSNEGSLTASSGTVSIVTGTLLSLGWDDATWLDGQSGLDDHEIGNSGQIVARDIRLEAQRVAFDSIRNEGGTLSASHTITLVTGTPGVESLGTYQAGTFGISNTGGTMRAGTAIVVTHYFTPSSSQPSQRIFNPKDAAQRAQLQSDFRGGEILEGAQDNTPTSTSAPVINSSNTFTVTGNIVIPQLSASMTHLNATSNAVTPTLAMAKTGSEQVRGDRSQAAAPKPKARVKAKPVLVRGAFFDSKISSVLTPNP